MSRESRSSRAVERLSGTALALVSLCVLVLAWLVDRTLSSSWREETRRDASESAAALSSFLAVRAEALAGLHATVAAAPMDAQAFARAVRSHGAHLGDFRAVWIADTTGRVVHAIAPTGGAQALPDPQRLAPLIAAARGAPFVHVSSLVPLSDGGRGIVLVEPVRVVERIVGFAGASIDSARLVHTTTATLPRDRSRLILVAGHDSMVVSTGLANRRDARARASVEGRVSVPGGQVWRVIAPQPVLLEWPRFALWTIAVGALALLAVALIYERAQAWRLTERSQELERLSMELLRANRSKSEFLANVSHELRTPLNAIVGFADLLRDGVYGELAPRQTGPVERIEASANHLRHLVDQILDLAKMAAGRLEVHGETIDLRAFVLQVASDMEPLIQERGLTLSISVGTTLPRVRTDPTHLRQILVNLLGNAIKFTPQGGITIRARLVDHGVRAAVSGQTSLDGGGVVIEESRPSPVRAGLPGLAGLDERAVQAVARLLDRSPKPDGRWIALQVADTGIGIPEQDRERIFDEFEQVNAGPRGDSMRRGTGLGLPISRRLARLLGGDITLESELGRGSVFTFWIHIGDQDVAGRATSSRTGS